MDVLPLPELGHQGYLVRSAGRALVVDAPLDTDSVTEFLPGGLAGLAVVETGLPHWRVAGGRLLADAVGAELYGPAGKRLTARTRIDGFPEAGVIGAPARTGDEVAVMIGDLLFVGDLDASVAAGPQVTATRRDLAGRFPDHRCHGSGGVRPAPELAQLPPPAAAGPGAGLNAEAVVMTNQGRADLYWADPRFTDAAPEVDRSYVMARAGSPWAPLVVDLAEREGDVQVPPERLASEIGRLEASREVVVVAADPAVAEAAAGFLRRLGVNAVWAR